MLAAQTGLIGATRGSPQPIQHIHIAQCVYSDVQGMNQGPRSEGGWETSIIFHKNPKGFRVCLQMNKTDVC